MALVVPMPLAEAQLQLVDANSGRQDALLKGRTQHFPTRKPAACPPSRRKSPSAALRKQLSLPVPPCPLSTAALQGLLRPDAEIVGTTRLSNVDGNNKRELRAGFVHG